MADALSVSTSAYVRATETAEYVRSQLPEVLQKPKIAIVCGSGLGGLAETIESGPKVELAYATIPNFPQSTVQGHAGKFVFGQIGPQKTPVALLVGRAQSVLLGDTGSKIVVVLTKPASTKVTAWTPPPLLPECANF